MTRWSSSDSERCSTRTPWRPLILIGIGCTRGVRVRISEGDTSTDNWKVEYNGLACEMYLVAGYGDHQVPQQL